MVEGQRVWSVSSWPPYCGIILITWDVSKTVFFILQSEAIQGPRTRKRRFHLSSELHLVGTVAMFEREPSLQVILQERLRLDGSHDAGVHLLLVGLALVRYNRTLPTSEGIGTREGSLKPSHNTPSLRRAPSGRWCGEEDATPNVIGE